MRFVTRYLSFLKLKLENGFMIATTQRSEKPLSDRNGSLNGQQRHHKTASEELCDELLAWVEFSDTKAPELLELLYQKYKVLSQKAAEKYVRYSIPYRSLLDPEDIQAYADIGLLEAINSFNPFANTEFKTHAHFRIRGAIIDGLRSVQNFPRFVAKIKREILPLLDTLRQELCREPSLEELAARFPKFHIDGILISKLICNPLIRVSIFNQLSADDSSEIGEAGYQLSVVEQCLQKNCKNPQEMPDAKMHRVDFIGVVLNVLKEDKDEQTIVYLYYFFGMTTTDISNVVKLSATTVSLKKNSGLSRIRKLCRSDEGFAEHLLSLCRI